MARNQRSQAGGEILVMTKMDLTDRIVQTIMYTYARSTPRSDSEESFLEVQRGIGSFGSKTGGKNHFGEEDFSGGRLSGG